MILSKLSIKKVYKFITFGVLRYTIVDTNIQYIYGGY